MYLWGLNNARVVSHSDAITLIVDSVDTMALDIGSSSSVLRLLQEVAERIKGRKGARVVHEYPVLIFNSFQPVDIVNHKHFLITPTSYSTLFLSNSNPHPTVSPVCSSPYASIVSSSTSSNLKYCQILLGFSPVRSTGAEGDRIIDVWHIARNRYDPCC